MSIMEPNRYTLSQRNFSLFIFYFLSPSFLSGCCPYRILCEDVRAFHGVRVCILLINISTSIMPYHTIPYHVMHCHFNWFSFSIYSNEVTVDTYVLQEAGIELRWLCSSYLALQTTVVYFIAFYLLNCMNIHKRNKKNLFLN